MKLHWLQHVPFEGLGIIEGWAHTNAMDISCTRLHAEDSLPSAETFDWLVIMGGPMSIHDHNKHPWLIAEKNFIGQAIHRGKTIIGICLGAQLIADVLGAKVYRGPHKEIGWFPIHRMEGAPDLIPEQSTVFHWHGDTFDIPKGAVPLAVSDSGINQGFVYNDRVIGLQFHMETTIESMEALIANCGHELVDAPFIQTAEQMRSGAENIETVNSTMAQLLDKLRFQ
jgi:GMP synthase (glutamine-hydrolysing)